MQRMSDETVLHVAMEWAVETLVLGLVWVRQVETYRHGDTWNSLLTPCPRFPLARMGTRPSPLPGGLATSQWWTRWRSWLRRPLPRRWVVDARSGYLKTVDLLRRFSDSRSFLSFAEMNPLSSVRRLQAMFPEVVTSLLALSIAKLSSLILRKLEDTKNTPFKVAFGARICHSI